MTHRRLEKPTPVFVHLEAPQVAAIDAAAKRLRASRAGIVRAIIEQHFSDSA